MRCWSFPSPRLCGGLCRKQADCERDGRTECRAAWVGPPAQLGSHPAFRTGRRPAGVARALAASPVHGHGSWRSATHHQRNNGENEFVGESPAWNESLKTLRRLQPFSSSTSPYHTLYHRLRVQKHQATATEGQLKLYERLPGLQWLLYLCRNGVSCYEFQSLYLNQFNANGYENTVFAAQHPLSSRESTDASPISILLEPADPEDSALLA